MSHESGTRSPDQPRRRRQSQIGEALAASTSPGELGEAVNASRGNWPDAGSSADSPAAMRRERKSLIGKLLDEFRSPPGPGERRSLLGLFIRELRCAPRPVQTWIAGVAGAVVAGLIVAYLTAR